MDLEGSYNLKELPDLSRAINLETLELSFCESLLEIPSSFSNLHKLQKLMMVNCVNLQVIPAHMDLASLEHVNMERCLKLRNFPVMSTNIKQLDISKTVVEDVPESISQCSRLVNLFIRDNRNLKGITHFPPNVLWVDLSYSSIEKIPDCMKALHQLHELNLSGCRRLTSLPTLPSSLNNLNADDCESLETVYCHLNQTPDAMLSFINCFKLDQQARQAIIQGSCFRGSALLPGREVPIEFDHRARGRREIGFVFNSQSHVFNIVECGAKIWIDESIEGSYDNKNEISFELSTSSQDLNVVECGVQILTDKADGRINNQESHESRSQHESQESDEGLFDVSNGTCSESVPEDDNESLSHGNSESCLEQNSEDDDESLSDESNVSCSELVSEDNDEIKSEDDESLCDESNVSCSELVSEEDDESLSHGNNESCLELLSEDDNESLSHGNNESCLELVSDDECLSDGSYESCSVHVFEEEDESHSDESYQSCSEQVFETDDESLSDGNNV